MNSIGYNFHSIGYSLLLALGLMLHSTSQGQDGNKASYSRAGSSTTAATDAATTDTPAATESTEESAAAGETAGTTEEQPPALPSNRLIVRRTSLTNFMSDQTVLTDQGKVLTDMRILPSTFAMISENTDQTFYWDPHLCRLIAIRNSDKTPDFIELTAEGGHPLGLSPGVMGNPKFFGMRYVEGDPEFLYTYGQLSVEERFTISDDGRRIHQTFKVLTRASQGSCSFTTNWRETVTANNGRWKGNVISLRKDELKKGVRVTYHLDPSAPRKTY